MLHPTTEERIKMKSRAKNRATKKKEKLKKTSAIKQSTTETKVAGETKHPHNLLEYIIMNQFPIPYRPIASYKLAPIIAVEKEIQ